MGDSGHLCEFDRMCRKELLRREKERQRYECLERISEGELVDLMVKVHQSHVKTLFAIEELGGKINREILDRLTSNQLITNYRDEGRELAFCLPEVQRIYGTGVVSEFERIVDRVLEKDPTFVQVMGSNKVRKIRSELITTIFYWIIDPVD